MRRSFQWLLGAVFLFLWLAWSLPLFIRWVGVEVPAQRSEVWSFPYTHQFKKRTAYRARMFYYWNGRLYQREFQIDKDRFVRLQKQERLKVAFLPFAPAWQPLLEGDFALWTDRAILSFLGFLLNVGFWGTLLESRRKKKRILLQR